MQNVLHLQLNLIILQFIAGSTCIVVILTVLLFVFF